jgi:hypothetical protein
MPERRRTRNADPTSANMSPNAPKPKRWSWLKTAAGSAALAIIGWEAVRFYRKNVRGEVERNPDPALPPAPAPMSPSFGSPIVPLPIPFPMTPPPANPPPAPTPASRNPADLSVRELSAMLKAARARERDRALDLAMMDWDE